MIYKKECINELLEVYKDCDSSNWDGYDALPISMKTYNNTLYIIGMFPKYIDHPEITPCPDNSISLDWIKDRYDMFCLNISDTKIIHVMYCKNGNTISRIFNFDNDKLNLIKYIVFCLSEL